MEVILENVSKQFDSHVHALKSVSAAIPSGSLTAVLGPSGSGKTTLLRIIAGLEQPSGGGVCINGRYIEQLPPQERGVGFVFQNYALFRHMNVHDNIAFGLKIRKRTRSSINERVGYLLELTGLQGLQNRYPHQLSGGQQQRVALARALAPQPALLLLDEPFAAVDAQLKNDLRNFIKDLHQEMCITSIFVTHDQQDALEVADQVIIFNDGQIEQAGTPVEIYESPATPFVASFIGGVNRFRTALYDGQALLGPMKLTVDKDFARCKTVDMLIRPEDIEIRPGDVSGYVASVLTCIFLGQYFKVELLLSGGIVLTAHVGREKGKQLVPGARVGVNIRKNRCFIA